MITYKKIYDISVILGEESIDYPGDTPYSRQRIMTIEESGICDLSELKMSAHSGTHIDTPAHFIAGGETLDQYKAENFILPAVVIDIKTSDAVTPEHLSGIQIDPGDAVLFRTKNSTSGICRNGKFSKAFVYLSQKAAEECVKKELSLVGLDYISIEEYGNETFGAHRALLGNRILVLEGINLSRVAAGRYTLLCLPLKMKGAEASPVRAILLN